MSMTVSLGGLENFVTSKVDQGEYESPSEVLREALQLLKQREECWEAGVRAKIEEGMAQCRAGEAIPGEQAWAELKKWRDEQESQCV